VFIGWGDACDSTKVYFRFSGGRTNHEESNYSWVGPLLEQEYFVGEVNVCMLEVVAELPNNLKRYKVSQLPTLNLGNLLRDCCTMPLLQVITMENPWSGYGGKQIQFCHEMEKHSLASISRAYLSPISSSAFNRPSSKTLLKLGIAYNSKQIFNLLLLFLQHCYKLCILSIFHPSQVQL